MDVATQTSRMETIQYLTEHVTKNLCTIFFLSLVLSRGTLFMSCKEQKKKKYPEEEEEERDRKNALLITGCIFRVCLLTEKNEIK